MILLHEVMYINDIINMIEYSIETDKEEYEKLINNHINEVEKEKIRIVYTKPSIRKKLKEVYQYIKKYLDAKYEYDRLRFKFFRKKKYKCLLNDYNNMCDIVKKYNTLIKLSDKDDTLVIYIPDINDKDYNFKIESI